MNTIIGTGFAADNLYLRVKILTTRLGIPEMPLSVAQEITWLMTDQLLRMRSKWLPRQEFDWTPINAQCHEGCVYSSEEITARELTGNDQPIEIRELLYCEILVPVLDEIDNRLLTPNIGDGQTWCIYTLERLANGDSYIRNEGDYRIWDWTRQQEALAAQQA